MGKPCEVCAGGEAKYKCPACRLPYCSAACYKRHREAPCGAAAAAAAPSAAAAGAGPEPEARQSQPEASAAAAAVTPTAASATESEEDEQLPRLTDAQLGRLRASELVRARLADAALTQALAKVDAAPDRMKELEKAMLDPTFASFICQALDETSAAGPTTAPA